MGFRVTKDGIKPDPQKAETVQQTGRPQNKDELNSFLCMIRSNGQFIPNLATATANLRDLAKDSSTFHWTHHHEQTSTISKKPSTKTFFCDTTTQPTYISVDAHQTGFSAILTQGSCIEDAMAVVVALRATTETEKKYSQLDLEATVVDFSL